MKSNLECIPCSLRQALWNATHVTTDAEVAQRCLNSAMQYLQSVSLDMTPAEISSRCAWIACEVTGEMDPFKDEKRKYNDIALNLIPQLEQLRNASNDKLYSTLLMAVAGNIIDLGIFAEVNVEETVSSVISRGLTMSHYEAFLNLVVPGSSLLYIGDNAGEIVFDKLVVEELTAMGMEVVFVVKSAPISNDATMEDAEYVGMTQVARVIETGSGEMGVPTGRCSNEFYAAYDGADAVLAKGHANFETLERPHLNRYFLLTAKCPIVGRELGVNVGDTVFVRR